MNIFVLDLDAKQAAEQYCDKHVIKQVLETAQLLCSVYHLQEISAPYKLTHKNHPCAVWARSSIANFDWLLIHAKALCEEYAARYGKRHKTEEVINWCENNKHQLAFPSTELSPFSLAMPDEFKVEGNPVESYRNYYREGKKHLHQWKRNRPAWL